MKIWLPEELKFMTNSRLKQGKSNASFKNKTVIISGSTSGVGKATLEEFAKHDAHIVMVVRNKQKANDLRNDIRGKYNVKIDIVICDFSDFDSVRQAAKHILDTYKTIDVLINSVGIHTTKRIYTKNNIEMSFMVNHLSVFLFTVLLIPRLKENKHSRIIQVNSEGHRFNGLRIKDVNFKKRIYTGLKGYGQSKVAQLYTVYELAERLKDSNVTINAMHPGAVKSNIGSNNGWLYRTWYKIFTQHFLGKSTISGESIYYLSTEEKLKNQSGNFYNLTILEKPAWHAVKKHKQQPIWDLTLKMCGLPDDMEV
jgi:NAD(P)-dependent dehydrogenase (short-subunit alcohol dehydrogenase family)